jgi:uncharacterized phiE125 gp8 family phage protein
MAYCTVAGLKAYLGVGDGADDALLLTLIGAAQAVIEKQTGRTFEATADSVRYLDARADVRGAVLWLDADCAAITSIVNGDGATVAANKYVTDPRNGTPIYAVRLLGSSGMAWTGGDDNENAIAVTGKWAFSVEAPADIVQACTRLAAFFYRQKDNMGEGDRAIVANGATVLPVALPKDMLAMLAPYKRLV